MGGGGRSWRPPAADAGGGADETPPSTAEWRRRWATRGGAVISGVFLLVMVAGGASSLLGIFLVPRRGGGTMGLALWLSPCVSGADMYAASSSSESSFVGGGISRVVAANVGFGGTLGETWGDGCCWVSPRNLAGLGAGLGAGFGFFAVMLPALTGRGLDMSGWDCSGEAKGTVMFRIGFGDLSGGGPPFEVRIGVGLGLRAAGGEAACWALFCSNIFTREVVGWIDVASVGSDACDEERLVREGRAFASAVSGTAPAALSLALISLTAPGPGSESLEVLLEPLASTMLLRFVLSGAASEAGVCRAAARVAAIMDGERTRSDCGRPRAEVCEPCEVVLVPVCCGRSSWG